MAKHEEEPQEEEAGLVDPQTTLREKCLAKPDCTKLSKRLETCNERVRGREKTSETCHEEVVDLFHCVDHCLFNVLKR